MVSAVRGHSIDIDCRMCGQIHNVLVNVDDFIEWQSGKGRYIQDIFDYLSSAERELLLTSTCDDCWQILYEAEMRDDED